MQNALWQDSSSLSGFYPGCPGSLHTEGALAGWLVLGGMWAGRSRGFHTVGTLGRTAKAEVGACQGVLGF